MRKDPARLSASEPSDIPVKSDSSGDLTGRERMVWNLMSGWGGHLVFVVAGFVMPRMIDRQSGQLALGVWDLCWSVVTYFGLANLGIGASVNRYVARYRATNDVEALRRTV